MENPPKEIKAAVKEKVEAKLILPKIPEKAKGKQPEPVVVAVALEEEDDDESSSSVLEEDDDLSEMDEDEIAAGERAHARHPGGAFFGMRIGYRKSHRLPSLRLLARTRYRSRS